MKSELLIQFENKETLIENIAAEFKKKPKKVYLITGTLKETGFKMIEDEMIDTTAKLVFAVGIDKKNTVRSMLETMLGYTKDVYIYSNNGEIEFESSFIIFEYSSSAVVITLPSSVSESSLKDNINIFSKLSYDLENKEDKEIYKGFIKNIVSKIEKELFTKITKSSIDELVNSKEIFSMKQYNHTVKSIAELVGKSSKEDKNENSKNEIESAKIEIPKVDLSDIDIDFDFSDVQEDASSKEIDSKKEKKSKKESQEKIVIDDDFKDSYDEDLKLLSKLANDEKVESSIENDFEDLNVEYDDDFDENKTLDIEDLLFSKADIKLDLDKEEKEEKSKEENEFDEDEIVKVKKVNLNNITNFIFELPSKTTKGQDVTSLKIPNYIKQMMPEFFGMNDDAKNVEIDGSIYKIRNINLEIIDAKINQKYSDREAKIVQKKSQSYLYFSSEKFQEINYEENDIARIIKLSNDTYHIEIISKDLQEYKLWSKICTQKFKASSRKYGMM